MKSVAASTFLVFLSSLGLLQSPPQSDEALIRSHVAADVVYASFLPMSDPAPLPIKVEPKGDLAPATEPAKLLAPQPVAAPVQACGPNGCSPQVTYYQPRQAYYTTYSQPVRRGLFGRRSRGCSGGRCR